MDNKTSSNLPLLGMLIVGGTIVSGSIVGLQFFSLPVNQEFFFLGLFLLVLHAYFAKKYLLLVVWLIILIYLGVFSLAFSTW